MTAIELRGIVKRFGPVIANDGIDLALKPGEIVALVGENGAGKSTLVNILYGALQPDAGEIRVAGEPVIFASPHDAIARGLGMVHQHFMLFPSLSVAENVVFAAEPARRAGLLGRLVPGLIDREAALQRVADLSRRHGLDVDPEARVSDLPVGVRQRVEILKLLHRSAEVLILDEPTAVLTPGERQGLFDVLDRLRDQGKAILFITHKLDEVMALSDRAVVLRDGERVASLDTRETTEEVIASAMIGRDLDWNRRAPAGTPGEVILEVDDLRVAGLSAADGVSELVRGVSLQVHRGEIVGLAGVAGNGQSALIEAVVGLRPAAAGTIAIAGRDVTRDSVADRRAAGMAYVPEDRHRAGMAPDASVHDNLLMGHHRQLTRYGFLAPGRVAGFCRGLLARLGIVLGDAEDAQGAGARLPASALSGGNQQRLVLGRELARDGALLIAEQPTRGVDIQAIARIRDELIAYRDAGHGVLLVSSELSEILALCDRIAVMYEGRVIGELDREQAGEAELGLLMAGRAA